MACYLIPLVMDCAQPGYRLNMYFSCLGLRHPHLMHRRCKQTREMGSLDIKIATGIAGLMGEVHDAFDSLLD
jgi:hypothetical protein